MPVVWRIAIVTSRNAQKILRPTSSRRVFLGRNQTLARATRLENLALDLAHAILRLQNAHHAEQPPRRVARLRADAHPVPCARHVERNVLPRPAVGVAGTRLLGLGVVGAEDFEGARVACGADWARG